MVPTLVQKPDLSKERVLLQSTIKTTKQADGTVRVSVEYDPSRVKKRLLSQARRSLESETGLLFTSVEALPTAGSATTWEFVGIMNPHGSAEAVEASLHWYRNFAEKITGHLCCIDLDGLKEDPPKRPPPRPRRKKVAAKS
jgi:hypothetical protein